VVIDADRGLAEHIRGLSTQRMVFFAGLPGTSKSLLVHQLAHLARDAGRRVHLVQWDVARPVFEASPAGRRYPLADGVTHAVIRKAAGLWVRRAVVRWNRDHPDAEDLLIGETPFIGNRFVELARRIDDDAEALLASLRCRFAIAVPSREVRRFLEAERERRAASPRHPREREDAPPQVLRALWRDLAEVARGLGISAEGEPSTGGDERRGAAVDTLAAYEPGVYVRFYETILRHRRVDVIALDRILPTEGLSPYDFGIVPPDLVPTAGEAEQCIRDVECRYPDPAALEIEMGRWWQV
jgi:hypothetical protein